MPADTALAIWSLLTVGSSVFVEAGFFVDLATVFSPKFCNETVGFLYGNGLEAGNVIKQGDDCFGESRAILAITDLLPNDLQECFLLFYRKGIECFLRDHWGTVTENLVEDNGVLANLEAFRRNTLCPYRLYSRQTPRKTTGITE